MSASRNLPHMSCDEIDSISEPVAVIPSMNAYLISISGFCFIKSCTDIDPNTEIILDTYGNRYKFVPKENLVENFI